MSVTRPRPVVQLTATGAEDVVLVLRGGVDAATARRGVSLLRAAVETGAQHVIIDLSAAGPVSPSFGDAIARLRADLETRAGWLLLEGAPPALADLEPELPEVFDAYRAALVAVPAPRSAAEPTG